MKDLIVFDVIKPGMLTTIQDLGRIDYQKYGVVVSGAMDSYACRIANILVGNPENMAALEITLMGPELYVNLDCIISITGADLSPTVNGKSIPMWSSIAITAGSIIKFGSLIKGLHAYMSVQGGFDVPKVLGSRSTYLNAKIGGYQGRALRKGDQLKRLPQGPEQLQTIKHVSRRLSNKIIPEYTNDIYLRVIPSIDLEKLGEEVRNWFLINKFQITPQSNRMGFRLKSEPIKMDTKLEKITEPVVFGAIQLPPDGCPILLMADRQTTGGYPIIANIISVDLPKIAQGKPGDHVTFSMITVDESQEILKEQENVLKILRLGY